MASRATHLLSLGSADVEGERPEHTEPPPFRVRHGPGGKTLRKYHMQQVPLVVVFDRRGQV